MKRFFMLVLAAAVMMMPLTLSGCQSSTSSLSTDSSPSSAAAPKKTFALVCGDAIGDRGFNDMANNGIVEAAKKYGITYKVFECHVNPSIYLSTIKAAASKYDVVLLVPGYYYDEQVKTVQQLYPKTTFVYFDGVSTLKGVKSVQFSQNEGAFLAGVLAAKLTTDASVNMINDKKIVGFVGGTDLPVIEDYQTGFEQGVKYADPSVQVIAKYGGSMTDPATGKTVATNIFNGGADVIFQAAGSTGLGVLQAAQAKKFIAIGVDTDQGYLAPGYVVSSMLKRVDTAVCGVVQDICDGKQLANVTTYDVSNGGIELVKNDQYNKMVPENVRQAVSDAEDKIKSGAIKVNHYK